ncbi:DUF1561 family protein [Candidatus Ichthyocystis hellenicum]|uniref:DUF1561 family protein n=1 Tax=Candidatus Ichthyocystis hellenicum TaxID=1561003 RepID=UPI001F5F841F|nr:DUF1561 family protein [Candidatus Ichthyocystis hellenicum]
MFSHVVWSMYYHGEKADDFSEKLKVVDNGGATYCYSGALGGLFSVFNNKIYLYLDSCDNSPPVRYDIYGRLSIKFNDFSYCLTAPSRFGTNDKNWLYFSQCDVGNVNQQWEFRGNSIFLRGTKLRIQHYNAIFTKSFYGVVCNYSSNCYDDHLVSSYLNEHYSYPYDISFSLQLRWKSDDGTLYHVTANGCSSASESDRGSIFYDPRTRRLSYQSYKVEMVSGLIYHVPQKKCLSSPLVNSEGDWGWVSWEDCYDYIDNIDAVVSRQRWIPIRINSTEFFSDHANGAVYWQDDKGNYLVVSDYNNSFGYLYVVNGSKINSGTRGMSPSVFYVSSPAGQDWLDFEAQSFLATFNDNGKYCSPNYEDSSPNQDYEFGKYFTILKMYAMRDDRLYGCRNHSNNGNLLCFIQGINALFVVTHPLDKQPLYPVDYEATVSEFLQDHHHSLSRETEVAIVTDNDHIAFLNSLFDKVLPGRVYSLTKNVGMSISELIGFVYHSQEGIYAVLAQDQTYKNKKHLFLVLRESSEQFHGIRILDTNIHNDDVSIHNFTDDFYGRENINEFFYRSHLDVDNIFAFRVIDNIYDGSGNMFYPLRDCSEEKNNYVSSDTYTGFSARDTYRCMYYTYEAKLVPSRCWYH